MKAPKLGLAVAVAAALVLSACSSGTDSDDDGGDGDGGSSDNADIKICMYTHGDGGGVLVGRQEGCREGRRRPRCRPGLPGVEQRPRGAGPAHRGRRQRRLRRHRRLGPQPGRHPGRHGQGQRRGHPAGDHELRQRGLPGPARLHPRRPGRVHRRPGGRQEVQGARRDQGAVPDPGGQQHRSAAALRRREGHLRQRREPAALRGSRRPDQERGRDPGQARGGPAHRRGVLAERRHRHRLVDAGLRGRRPRHHQRHRRPVRRRGPVDRRR